MEVWKIREGLFQSSKIDDIELFESHKFDVVIDLEGGIDDIPKNKLTYLYCRFLDAPFLPHKYLIRAVSCLGFCLWRAGDKVLVHCSQGINRSSLVNGVILNLHGYTGKEAVELITTARPGALLNPVFKIYLLGLP